MPKGAYLRDKFIKHFAAKAFRFTPQDVDDMDAEE